MKLSSKDCVPCRGGLDPLSVREVKRLLAETPGWDAIDNFKKIQRSFRFRDFKSAMAFVLDICHLAEEQGHHPDITFGWGYCSLVFFTHAINGLHENDFIMAAKVNAITGDSPSPPETQDPTV